MLTIYTDGAVSKNGTDEAYGGWAYVCVWNPKDYPAYWEVISE